MEMTAPCTIVVHLSADFLMLLMRESILTSERLSVYYLITSFYLLYFFAISVKQVFLYQVLDWDHRFLSIMPHNCA